MQSKICLLLNKKKKKNFLQGYSDPFTIPYAKYRYIYMHFA